MFVLRNSLQVLLVLFLGISTVRTEEVNWRSDYQCGPKHGNAECNPDSGNHCCSPYGWCDATPAHCHCPRCIDYRKVHCPDGWRHFGGHCYYLSRTVATWHAAEDACEKLGSKLVSIKNAGENRFLQGRIIFKMHDLWIGMYDEYNPSIAGGYFESWQDGSPVVYTNWKPGQPDNHGGEENCAEMMNPHGFGNLAFGQWNDKSCSDTNLFICKLELNARKPSEATTAIPAHQNETQATTESDEVTTVTPVPVTETQGTLSIRTEEVTWRSDYRCGSDYGDAECNPDSTNRCCSQFGWCDNTPAHCLCLICIDYKKATTETDEVTTVTLVPVTEIQATTETDEVTNVTPVPVTETQAATTETDEDTTVTPGPVTETQATTETDDVTTVTPVPVTETQATAETDEVTTVTPVPVTETQEMTDYDKTSIPTPSSSVLLPSDQSVDRETKGLCPAGWSHFGRHCYFSSPELVTFYAAMNRCQAMHNSTVPSINSQEENAFLYDFIKGDKHSLWINFLDQYLGNGDFQVWKDGSPVEYSNWYPGKPDHAGGVEEPCAQMMVGQNDGDDRQGMWDDIQCYVRNRFVCKTAASSAAGVTAAASGAGGAVALAITCVVLAAAAAAVVYHRKIIPVYHLQNRFRLSFRDSEAIYNPDDTDEV